MEESGLKSTKTLSAAKRELSDLGYVEITERANKTNIYKLWMPEKAYTIVDTSALVLSSGPFRTLAYLRSLYVDEEGKHIKLKKIKDDLRISKLDYLLQYLQELSYNELLTWSYNSDDAKGQIKYVDISKRQIQDVDKSKSLRGQKEKATWTKVKTNHTLLITFFESHNMDRSKNQEKSLSSSSSWFFPDPSLKDSFCSVQPPAAAPPRPAPDQMSKAYRRLKSEFEYLLSKERFTEIENFDFDTFYEGYNPIEKPALTVHELSITDRELASRFVAHHRQYGISDEHLLNDALSGRTNYQAWLFRILKKQVGLKWKPINRRELHSKLFTNYRKKEFAIKKQEYFELSIEQKRPIMKYAAHEYRLWDTSKTYNKINLYYLFVVQAMHGHILYKRFCRKNKSDLQKELNESKVYQQKLAAKEQIKYRKSLESIPEEEVDLLAIWENQPESAYMQ
jgi:hypothetical protein